MLTSKKFRKLFTLYYTISKYYRKYINLYRIMNIKGINSP